MWVRKGWRAGAAGVLGVLFAGGFAPLGWWPLAPLALAGAFALTVQASWRGAWRMGLCFGLGSFGAGIYWIYVSCHRYGGMSPPLAVTATLALVFYMALFPAAAFAVGRRIARTETGLLLAALPGAWVLAEAARAVLFTGFPWLSLGYSQVAAPAGGYAPLIGVYGVGLITAACGGALALSRHGGRRAALGLGLVALLSLAGFGLGRMAFTQAAGPALGVTLLQGNISQLLKWDPEHLESTLSLYATLSDRNWDSQVVVWPENAIPAFPQQLEPAYLSGLHGAATRAGVALLIGMPTLDPMAGTYYNAVVGFGTAHGEYRKRHLVPFGEYVPFQKTLGQLLELLEVPLSDFGRGAASQAVVQAGPWPVGVAICYEALFPREVAAGAARSAYLVHVSNDAWFGNTSAPHQLLEITRMRARETGRYVARATNTGISAVIDPQGRIVARAPAFEVAALRGSVVPHQGETPYVRLGDALAWGGAAVLLLLGAVRRRRTRAL